MAGRPNEDKLFLFPPAASGARLLRANDSAISNEMRVTSLPLCSTCKSDSWP